MEDWEHTQALQYRTAAANLAERVVAETGDVLIRKRADADKRQERVDKEREKYEAQQQKEHERAQREADRIAEEQREEERKDLEAQEILREKPIPEFLRFEHTHILGPSRSGKTTLLQQIILDDLNKDNPPPYVIIDPKGLLTDRLSRLAVFSNRLRDRLVVIDPTKQPLPALGMFDVPSDMLNQVLETFGYVFSGADSRLTSRQTIPFAYVAEPRHRSATACYNGRIQARTLLFAPVPSGGKYERETIWIFASSVLGTRQTRITTPSSPERLSRR